MPTNRDDDILDSPVPDPDMEATPSERAHAKAFADIIDKAIAGKTPPAMSADDRALVEVATVIRAANGQLELSANRQRSLVEDALRQAVGGVAASGSGAGVTPIARPRAKKWVPWAITGLSTAVAAAAVLVLWLRAPETKVVEKPAVAKVPASWTSRPADPLIGPIAREQAGDASSRIDYIFADRLDGYRERRMTPRGGKP
ncbi:MAG: hypothetical protein H0T46_23445 [Deltaproteobacteria bacterium]|nr:hypothetical protein [Deltaproteobacteria bacterium]